MNLYDQLKSHAAKRAALHTEEVELAKALDDHDLTIPQFTAMLAIVEGTTTMGNVSDLSSTSRGNLTGIVDRLEHKAHIARVRSTRDRRVVDLVLTAAGIEVLAAIKATSLPMVVVSNDEFTQNVTA